MTRLLLVRHGESTWNAIRKLQGQQDQPLSSKGQLQAQQLAAVVSIYAPEIVISSDLLRAKETVQQMGFTPDHLEPELREAYLGDWEGASITALRETQNNNYQAWRDGTYNPPNAETFLAFYQRIRQAVKTLEQHQKTVLLVTHGGVVRAIMNNLFEMNPSKIIPVSPASLTIIDFTPEPRLRAYNITSSEAMLDPPD